ATPAADSLLVAGLLGARRDAYVAATALAQRLADLPPDAAWRSQLIPLLTSRLHVWGPLAPGSDVRGVLRLLEELAEPASEDARKLLEVAAKHPHPGIRAAGARHGVRPAAITPAPRR